MRFQEGVAELYPRLIAEKQTQLTAAPGNLSADSIPQWRLTDLEGNWACVVGPEHLTIETQAYTTWSVLRGRLMSAIEVHGLTTSGTARRHCSPRSESR